MQTEKKIDILNLLHEAEKAIHVVDTFYTQVDEVAVSQYNLYDISVLIKEDEDLFNQTENKWIKEQLEGKISELVKIEEINLDNRSFDIYLKFFKLLSFYFFQQSLIQSATCDLNEKDKDLFKPLFAELNKKRVDEILNMIDKSTGGLFLDRIYNFLKTGKSDFNFKDFEQILKEFFTVLTEDVNTIKELRGVFNEDIIKEIKGIREDVKEIIEQKSEKEFEAALRVKPFDFDFSKLSIERLEEIQQELANLEDLLKGLINDFNKFLADGTLVLLRKYENLFTVEPVNFPTNSNDLRNDIEDIADSWKPNYLYWLEKIQKAKEMKEYE